MRLTRIGLSVTLALGILSAPLATEAQQVGKVARIGILMTTYWPPLDALREGLRELGYVEGKNLAIEYRWAEQRTERFPELAAELVDLKVDVIVTAGTPAAQAAKNATKTIPIVMASIGDAVGTGIVPSLARPGWNITGLTSLNPELEGKRLELLKEAVPKVSRVAVLWNPTNPINAQFLKLEQAAAPSVNVRLEPVGVGKVADFEGAFAAITRQRPDALLVQPDFFLFLNRKLIADFAAKNRLPSMHAWREAVEAGGLMAYAANFPRMYRRAATYVDKVLKGTKPGDLPIEQATHFDLIINLKTAKALGLTIIEQATHFDLIINLKTAKALGLTIPQSILIRADKVTE